MRTKTDAVDELITEFCQRMAPAVWQPPSPNEQALRALVQRLEALQTMHTQEGNRLAVARDAVRTGIADHITWLDGEIKALIQEIRRYIDRDPDLKQKRDLLDSIPGVGERTIACATGLRYRPLSFCNGAAIRCLW